MPEIIVKLGDNVIQKYYFCQDRLTIGRALDNDIVIENLAVSRTHAILEREGDGYIVTDQGSANGTIINGTRVQKAQILNRDIITIGKYQLYFFDTHAAEERRRAMPCDQERTMLVPAAEPVPPELEVTRGRQKGMRFAVAGQSVTIGRGSENTIRLTDWFVSRAHATIERRGDSYVIRDLDSWRHTSVNGRQVKESILRNGDVIGLGPSVQLAFSVTEAPQPLMMARPPIEIAPPVDSAPVEPDPVEPEPEPDNYGFAYGYAAPDAEPAGSELFPAEPEPVDREPGEDVFDFEDEPAETAPAEPAPAVAELPPATDPAAAETLPRTDLRSVVEDMAVVSLHIAAVATSQELNRELNIKHEAAAEARQQIDEIHMWENALKNKSLVIRKQAARRLKQLTGRDYEYE